MSSIVAQHDFGRTFHVFHDLRAADIVLGLPGLDDEQVTPQCSAERPFTLRDDTVIENEVIEQPPECLLMSSTKLQMFMRKQSARAKGWTAKLVTMHLAAAELHPPLEFHLGDEFSDDHRQELWRMFFDNFPELLKPVDSPHASRRWGHPIDTTGQMRRQRLDCLSRARREELNRQLKDVIIARLIRPSCSEFDSPIMFVRKVDGSLRLCIDYRGLNEVTRKDACPLPRVDETLNELNDANLYTHLDLVSGFWPV
jgi:hypothetical protein